MTQIPGGITMIPQTPEHPQKRRDVYYSIGISPTVTPKERIAELHGSDSLAAKAVLELDQFLATPEFRQTLWYRAFYHQVLTGVSILYPHANAPGKAKMAQEYTDDLVHAGYLRALQSLTVPSGCKHVSFALEFAKSHGILVRTNQQEMDRFYAACKALLAVILPQCWNLARWCLYHCSRLLWRTLTGLCRIITGLLKRRRLILEDLEFSTRNRATAERIAHRKWRQRRKKNPFGAVRRFKRR
jgi:hypothetical protein